MRKLVSVLLTVAVAVSLMAMPAAVSANPGSPPTIDGVVGAGEWDGATVINVTSGMGTVSVIAETDYVYVLFIVTDSTDARNGQPVGNDKVGLNINPTAGAPWGLPCDIIFQTGTDPNAWNGHSCGTTDGWETDWEINGTQLSLPGDLQTMTLYNDTTRTSEWKIPLASIHPSPGDTLKVGGATDINGISYRYPIGLNWSDVSTYVDVLVQQPTSTVSLSANIHEITAISVSPTSIDYDTISPGYDYTLTLTVSNVGSVPVSVTTEITGDTLFRTCLTLNPATINPLVHGSPAGVDARLQVPLSYHAHGLETGTIIFEATAL